jgi:hypothetical protein
MSLVIVLEPKKVESLVIQEKPLESFGAKDISSISTG